MLAKNGVFMFSGFVLIDYINTLMDLDLQIVCWDFQHFGVWQDERGKCPDGHLGGEALQSRQCGRGKMKRYYAVLGSSRKRGI